MKALAEVYDFITGSSIASPIGLAIAIIVAIVGASWPLTIRAGAFAVIIIATLVVATLEKPL